MSFGRSLSPIIALFLLFLTPRVAWAASIDRIEASVNSRIILLSDLVEFRKLIPLRAQLDPLFGGTPIAKTGARSDDKELVNFLVDEALIAQKFEVKDSEVEQQIKSIQAENGIDRDALVAAIRQQGFSFEDYFKLIRVSMSKRNLIDRDIRTKVFISDDDLKNEYYNARRGKGTSTVFSYRIRIITIDPNNYQKASAARQTIERALRQIRSGEAFEDVAERMSDDPSARNGGDLGILSEKDMSPLIRQEVKRLKVGEVSAVLGSPNTAYFILKLSDIQSDEEDDFEKAKTKIRGELTAKEYQRQIRLWLDREKETAFIHLAGDPIVPK